MLKKNRGISVGRQALFTVKFLWIGWGIRIERRRLLTVLNYILEQHLSELWSCQTIELQYVPSIIINCILEL